MFKFIIEKWDFFIKMRIYIKYSFGIWNFSYIFLLNVVSFLFIGNLKVLFFFNIVINNKS